MEEQFSREEFYQWKHQAVTKALFRWLEDSLDNHCRMMGLGEFAHNDVAQHVHIGKNQMMAAILAITFKDLTGIEEEETYEGESV